MRILVPTGQWFPEATGGSARVATETAIALAARGHDVTVIAPASIGRPAVEQLAENLIVRRSLPRTRLPITLTDVVHTARAVRGDSRYDVALVHQSTCATGLIAAGFDAPISLVFHASALRELRFLRTRLTGTKRLGTFGLEPFLSWFERLSLERATSVLVLSEFSRGLIEADHPEIAGRITRVSGGVDVDRFEPRDGLQAARKRLGIRLDGTLLVTARRLEPRMGLEQLLEAVRIARGDGLDLRLAVIGSGSLDQSLRALAVDLGLGDVVDLRGRVPDTELVDWYRAADLFVLPTIAYEGFGMVTVEALASGVPVVGTPIGATPELLAPLDARLIAPSADAAGLAAAIRTALPLAGSELRTACREYACSEFAWSHVMDAWEKALEATSESSPRNALQPAVSVARG
jgi:glycosyltransferase involved in cell wall biosynthesis